MRNIFNHSNGDKLSKLTLYTLWFSYQIRKIAGCACAGNAGNVFATPEFKEKLLVSDPGMHHDARAVMHVGIANPRWQGKHSRRMRNPQFYVCGKRPMEAPRIGFSFR